MEDKIIKRKFTTLEIDKFIELSEDNAFFHSSSKFAKSKGFKDRICHGVMTLMPVSKILGEILPGNGYVIAELNTKFFKPILAGEEVNYRYSTKIKNDDIGYIKVEIIASTLLGEKYFFTSAVCKKV